jgi:TrpR family trp operon transcriptional repressor
MRGVMSKDPWRDFLALILQIKTKDELSAFCDLFLTIEEKETLASRFLIVKALLDEKLTQREISEKFKVSIAQITRGSNALKIIDPKLKAHLVKILSE